MEQTFDVRRGTQKAMVLGKGGSRIKSIGVAARAELERVMKRHHSAMARDLDDATVFLAESAFMLTYEKEKWPKITFSDVKDYQLVAPQ